MKGHVLIAGFTCLAVLTVGCAGKGPDSGPGAADRMATFEKRMRSQALEHEAEDDLQGAVRKLEALMAVRPDDQALAGELRRVKETARARAEEKFRLARSLLLSNRPGPARKAIMTALRYDPEHSEALGFLRTRLTAPHGDHFMAEGGELPGDIAERVYGNRDLGAMLAHLNALAEDVPIRKGSVITLPRLEPGFLAGINEETKAAMGSSRSGDREADILNHTAYELESQETHADEEQAGDPELQKLAIDSEITEGWALLKAERFEKALAVVSEIKTIQPDHPGARELENRALLEWGMQYFQEGEYTKAVTTLGRVDTSLPGMARAMEHVTVTLRERAMKHYNEGVRLFVEEQLENAIEEWRETLILDPEHETAAKDIITVESLLEKLKK